MTITDYFKNKSYPGRGIVAGLDGSTKKIFLAYFIMGRSENSRNRRFKQLQDGIKTEAVDISKVTDPSLIIYRPVKYINDGVIITNGDQTDTVFDFLEKGKSFEDALNTRTFEPDKPNFTPRISLLVQKSKTPLFKFCLIRASQSQKPIRNFYNYCGEFGKAYALHTYSDNVDPLPPFVGEPIELDINGDFEKFTAELWDSLDSENKISLFTQSIDISGGETNIKIINKYE